MWHLLDWRLLDVGRALGAATTEGRVVLDPKTSAVRGNRRAVRSGSAFQLPRATAERGPAFDSDEFHAYVPTDPSVPPVTRTRLLAIDRLRRFRLRPSKLPWRTMLGQEPGELPQQVPRVLGLSLEARVANALWTKIADLDGLDIGVGRRWVWVASLDGSLARIDSWSGTVVEVSQLPFTPKRISVSRSSPDANRPVERPWIVDSLGRVQVLNFVAKIWQQVGPPGAIDIAAGAVGFDGPPPDGSHDVYRVSTSGRVDRLVVVQGIAGWLKVGWFNPLGGSWPAAMTLAVERLPRVADGAGAADLWLVREDDQIGWSQQPHDPFATLPGGAWDVGAADDVVWAIGTTELPELDPKGTTLWRLDFDAQRWDRISPGWGVALDVDSDGNPWVLDSEGTLHVRGARMPAVFGNVRDKAKPGESWDAFLELYAQTQLLAGPGLGPEAALAARTLGAGGRVTLSAWDDYETLAAAGLGQNVLNALKEALSKARGFDQLFCVAPIFTSRPRVPGSLLPAALKLDAQNKQYFDLYAVRDAYVALIETLAAVPGFVERVRYLSLGNEVDVYLKGFPKTHPQWSTYFAFCKHVIEALRPTLPNTKFGVNWTFEGVQNFHFDQWREFATISDALFVNYYAVQPAPSYAVKSHQDYSVDIDTLLSIADAFGGGKPLVLQEVGMPTDPLLGGSNEKQTAFVQFLLNKWDDAGIRIRFLSWFALYDYLYDPTLKVMLDPNGAIAVTSTQYPYKLPNGAPFWGTAHNLPGLFLGPHAPGSDTSKPPTNADTVYWINQSTTAGTHAQRIARFLGTCGLLTADGQPKSVAKLQPGSPISAWHALRAGLEKRRRQT